MLDTTIRAYATRQAAMVALAVVLAASVALIGRSDARPGPAGSDRYGAVAAGGQVEGAARVLDGDTIDVAGTRIRLEGIDAPESTQTCQRADGERWNCGEAATRFLEKLVGKERVRCESRGLDKYGRTLGICFVASREINAAMVRGGMAWAFVRYSQSYVRVEAEARAAKAGIWSGSAMPAWEYRANRWADAEPAAPRGCAIKGNVGPNGLIYHMPWSPWYNQIRMDADKGKRWFCSEAEALAAGWRPVR